MSGRHYRALCAMHQQIQRKIEEARRSPQPDWMRISHLKRLRLDIKDRMRRILDDNRTGPETVGVSYSRRANRTTAFGGGT